mmetsp:Transcript_29350/g.89900  ORF Transcript_29350/g.89900 Transcript_29350/m.89900 type:complete len:227 (-) Transcript_29350:3198-3878(-)
MRTQIAETVACASRTDPRRKSAFRPVARPLVNPPRSWSSGYAGFGGRSAASEPRSWRIRFKNLLRMKKHRSATVSTHCARIGPPLRACSKNTSSDEEKSENMSHTTVAWRCPSEIACGAHCSLDHAASNSTSNLVVRFAMYSCMSGSTIACTSSKIGSPCADSNRLRLSSGGHSGAQSPRASIFSAAGSDPSDNGSNEVYETARQRELHNRKAAIHGDDEDVCFAA